MWSPEQRNIKRFGVDWQWTTALSVHMSNRKQRPIAATYVSKLSCQLLRLFRKQVHCNEWEYCLKSHSSNPQNIKAQMYPLCWQTFSALRRYATSRFRFYSCFWCARKFMLWSLFVRFHVLVKMCSFRENTSTNPELDIWTPSCDNIPVTTPAWRRWRTRRPEMRRCTGSLSRLTTLLDDNKLLSFFCSLGHERFRIKLENSGDQDEVT